MNMKIKFNITNYEPVEAGERVLEITKAEVKPSGRPTQMTVTFKDVKSNRTLQNNYKFDNNGSLTAMGIMCRIALNLADMDEFDTDTDTSKLVGKKLLCEVVHTEGTTAREDGTFPVFANIKKVISLQEDTPVATNGRATIPVGDDLD